MLGDDDSRGSHPRALSEPEKVLPGHFRHHQIHNDEFHITHPDGRKESITKRHRLAMVTLPELKAHITGAGFDDLRVFPGYDARTDGRADGYKMLVAAQRPA